MFLLSGVAFAASGGLAAPSGVTANQRPLAPGARGPAVVQLQRALGLRLTGRYDRATKRAVRRFQIRHRLKADGIAWPGTLAVLGIDAAAASSSAGSAPHPRLPGSAKIAAELRKIAQCESGGDPHAVSADGTYRGKYQFDQETWNSIGGTGDPAQASEAEQDRRALALYRRRGAAPWPNCA